MIKHDDGTIEYEVGDVVLDPTNDEGTVIYVDEEAEMAWVVCDSDHACAYRWKFDQLTPADPPADPPSEPPQRTVKQEWEYAMECAGIAAKHATPDDLAERVFVSIAASPHFGGWRDKIAEAFSAAKFFRDAQQAQERPHLLNNEQEEK